MANRLRKISKKIGEKTVDLKRRWNQLRGIQKPLFTRELMKYLNTQLPNPRFFTGLEMTTKPGVRILTFKERKVAIKDTSGKYVGGADPKRIRVKLAEVQTRLHRHRRSGLSTPGDFQIHSIPVYGKIGNYLIMAFIEGKNAAQLARQYRAFIEGKNPDDPEAKSFWSAYTAFEDFVKNEGIHFPQTFHSIVQNTNPANPARGKWIFYPPYDLM